MDKEKSTTVDVLTNAEETKRKVNSSIVATARIPHEPTNANIDEINNTKCRNIITQFQQITNIVRVFNDVDQCIDFVTDIIEEKTFIILSGTFARTIISFVQDIPQINCIYFFCDNVSEHDQWTNKWPKVKGVFTQVSSLCEILKKDARSYDQNAVSISFIPTANEVSKQNLDQLDQSFMYSQILKEILLTIHFDQQHVLEFTAYCCEHFENGNIALKSIDKLDREYYNHMPIWWYTYPCFLYSMLNQALRTMEVDTVIKMVFFLRDLHQNIAQLHTEQYTNQTHSTSFSVYRGQGMSQTDFHRLMKTKGGLMSFNNFLSTSRDREVSFAFAESNQNDPELIGVLFEITVDPSTSTIPFANIRDASYHQEEDEILFSMHSVFRIGQIKQFDINNNRLWQVELILTKDNDPQLHTLTDCIRKETYPTTKGWFRLGQLLITLGKFEKAQQVCKALFDQTSGKCEKASVYHLLGNINQTQGKYAEAIILYEKSIEIEQTTFPPNHLDVATSYSSMAVVYSKMNDYMKALSFYEKSLEIFKQCPPLNDKKLATCYDNIGSVYGKMGEDTKAFSFHEKALEIYQKILPSNHPDLALCYGNIAVVYQKMNDYMKALSFQEKASEIYEKSFPPGHPDLAVSYGNAGVLNGKMSKYSKALSYHEKALKIFEKTLPLNHPDLARCYENIGAVHHSMGDYPKALFYWEMAVEIYEKILPLNHPSLAPTYHRISLIYTHMGDFLKALSFSQLAVDIGQHSLRSHHPDLKKYLQNLEAVKKVLNYFSFLQK